MNIYSSLIVAAQAHLLTELTSRSYTDVETRRGIWKPETLQPFERYLVFLAPPLQNPWDERRLTTKEIAYTLRIELFLLVKNFNEDQSVFGDTAPNLGVFQMISDVKAILRATSYDGLIDRTFNETVGGSAFESGAATGLDTGAHGWVHRAKLLYSVQSHPFCHPGP